MIRVAAFSEAIGGIQMDLNEWKPNYGAEAYIHTGIEKRKRANDCIDSISKIHDVSMI